jgi:hypothetical protein
MRILLLGAVLAPAIAFSTPGFALSEDNCRMVCALMVGRERAPTCIAQLPCSKYRGQPDISAAEVRRRVAAYKAGKRNSPTNSVIASCARQTGLWPGPHGWFYDERRMPAINDCLTAGSKKR